MDKKAISRDLAEAIMEDADAYHYYTGVANYVADVMKLSDEDNVGIIIKVLKQHHSVLETLGLEIDWEYAAQAIVDDKEYAKEMDK